MEPKFIQFAESQELTTQHINFKLILESPPEKSLLALEQEIKLERKPIKVNYLEREQKNSSLGVKGEKLVLEYEKWRLNNLGKETLAEKIEWIAQNDDGAGFDILSKNENGLIVLSK